MRQVKDFYDKHEAFLKEFGIASLVIAAILFYAAAPVLFASNAKYPYTVDGMGHLTKIKYMADSLRSLHFSDWFPYWYNGSTVVQYYPPFSYLLLVPVQLLFDNSMITYKCFVFFSLFTGAMGVWCCYYYFLGSRSGILAGSLYALQPYLLLSMFASGVVAQGPVYAFSPWLVFFSILFFKKPTRGIWLAVCIIAFALILTHVMHSFIICLCLGMCFLIFMFMKKADASRIIQWAAAIGLGCGLAAYWWLPGVTQFENPGIPYLLPEAALLYTANWDWFSPRRTSISGLYFSVTMLLISLGTIPIMVRDAIKNKLEKEFDAKTYFIFFSLLLLLVTVIFSFGMNNPLFKYIPLHEQLVAGRILSLSSISAAVLTAYVIIRISKMFKSKRVAWLIIITILSIIFADINPGKVHFNIETDALMKDVLQSIPEKGSNFEKGRFDWIAPLVPNITYFPMIYGYNMSDGWNIEGTLHNHALWLRNTALSCDCDMYTVKNLMQWNAHSVVINSNYNGLKKAMESVGFYELKRYEEFILMYNPAKSSYLYRQNRDVIAIGKGIQGLSMSFPWIAAGKSPDIEDYSSEELSQYKLIYFSEPEIKNLSSFEERIKQLANEDKTIIIEMGRTEEWPILGIMPYDVSYDSSALLQADRLNMPNSDFSDVPLYYKGQSCALSGLDEVYYTLRQKTDTGEYPVIGTKKVGNKDIYFVGMGLSQLLRPSIIRTLGLVAVQPDMAERDKGIKNLLELLMDNAKPSKKILSDPFYPDNIRWSYKGASFKYSLDEPDNIIISVTYTPRWKIFLDGKPIAANNFENLILLKLPAGTHSVELKYGKTLVGWTGILLSIISLIMVLLMYFYLNQIYLFLDRLVQRFIHYFKQKPNFVD